MEEYYKTICRAQRLPIRYVAMVRRLERSQTCADYRRATRERVIGRIKTPRRPMQLDIDVMLKTVSIGSGIPLRLFTGGES